MRLIDADALLTERKKSKYYHLPNGDIAIPIIDVEHAPTVKPKPQWIPCSERMPEPRVDVWCYSDMGEMVGYYEEHIDAWYGRDYLELIVTAWMPLPIPYCGGNEE